MMKWCFSSGFLVHWINSKNVAVLAVFRRYFPGSRVTLLLRPGLEYRVGFVRVALDDRIS